jgi:hypothetical protein
MAETVTDRIPEPQVIGAPPAHLVEQPGIDSGPDHRSRTQRVLSRVVLSPRVGPVFGKVALADPIELEIGSLDLGPHPLVGRTNWAGASGPGRVGT